MFNCNPKEEFWRWNATDDFRAARRIESWANCAYDRKRTLFTSFEELHTLSMKALLCRSGQSIDYQCQCAKIVEES